MILIALLLWVICERLFLSAPSAKRKGPQQWVYNPYTGHDWPSTGITSPYLRSLKKDLSA